jgi:hypothetical protein
MTEHIVAVFETERAAHTATESLRNAGMIGREATERTETVKDTVRREDVEVTNDAGVRR